MNSFIVILFSYALLSLEFFIAALVPIIFICHFFICFSDDWSLFLIDHSTQYFAVVGNGNADVGYKSCPFVDFSHCESGAYADFIL